MRKHELSLSCRRWGGRAADQGGRANKQVACISRQSELKKAADQQAFMPGDECAHGSRSLLVLTVGGQQAAELLRCPVASQLSYSATKPVEIKIVAPDFLSECPSP